MPRRISCSTCRTTACDSFSDDTGLNGIGYSHELVNLYDHGKVSAMSLSQVHKLLSTVT
jgi:hypothetical protein